MLDLAINALHLHKYLLMEIAPLAQRIALLANVCQEHLIMQFANNV